MSRAGKRCWKIFEVESEYTSVGKSNNFSQEHYKECGSLNVVLGGSLKPSNC